MFICLNYVCNNSQTLYDIDAIGTAKFHSGFIAKINESGILSTSYRSQVVDAYVNHLLLKQFLPIYFIIFHVE